VKLAIDDVVMIQDSQPHALFGGTVGLGACLRLCWAAGATETPLRLRADSSEVTRTPPDYRASVPLGSQLTPTAVCCGPRPRQA